MTKFEIGFALCMSKSVKLNNMITSNIYSRMRLIIFLIFTYWRLDIVIANKTK